MSKAKKTTGRIKKIVEQAKEPLSLLETLKEEGTAAAMLLLSSASMMAKNIKPEQIASHLKDVFHAAGLATQKEVQELRERIEELETKLEEITQSASEE